MNKVSTKIVTNEKILPVITGAGWVTPFGTNTQSLTDLLETTKKGQSPDYLPELDLHKITGVKNKRTKRMDLLSKTASIAAFMAIYKSGLSIEGIKPGRGAVISGSSFGASLSIATFINQLYGEGPDSVNPNVFPPTSHNVAGGHISIHFSLSGPLIHFASGNLSSHLAIIYGADLIKLGRADIVLCGGWDQLSPDLSRQLVRANEPPLIPGASLFVLESAEHARTREAKILGTIEPSLSAISKKETNPDKPAPSIFIPEKLTKETYGYSGALSLAVALLEQREEPFTIEGISGNESASFVVAM